MSTTLAARAREAAAHLRSAETTDLADRRKAMDRARAQIRIAALLGLPLAAVTVTPDNRRSCHPFDCLIVAATDPADPAATYQFHLADPRYDDTPLHLLGACPACGGQVPLQEIKTLADLAGADHPLQFLADGSLPEILRTAFGSPAFLDDLGHQAACTYSSGTGRPSNQSRPTAP